jgi:hydroxypyruvate isomerase
MVFVDLPFEERVRRISDAGFEVEIWDWTKKDVDALARTSATFSSMTREGRRHAGTRGGR